MRQRGYISPVAKLEKLKELRVEDLQLSFGGVRALDGVSLEINKREILAIIGPNGAGKTCILNCISGFYRPQKGTIYFEGEEITYLPPYRIAQLGRIFQGT